MAPGPGRPTLPLLLLLLLLLLPCSFTSQEQERCPSLLPASCSCQPHARGRQEHGQLIPSSLSLSCSGINSTSFLSSLRGVTSITITSSSLPCLQTQHLEGLGLRYTSYSSYYSCYCYSCYSCYSCYYSSYNSSYYSCYFSFYYSCYFCHYFCYNSFYSC